MDDREAQQIALALIAVCIGLICEVYDWLRDDEDDEQPEVLRVNSDVVVLEAPEE